MQLLTPEIFTENFRNISTDELDVNDDGKADAPSNEVLLMVQFGAGFFLFIFVLAKLYRVVKKKVCGGDNDSIDPETGKLWDITDFIG